MPPLVSILIPAYNSAPWIAETVQSALAQTWQRKEIIVVDDGSTDETFAVAQKFAGPSVKVVRSENQGASGARNTAYSLSHGDYIQWLDADDLLAPDKVERQVLAATDPSVLLSGEFGSFLAEPASATFTRTALWEDLAPVDWLVRKLSQNVFMQTATWLVSRELTEKAGPWDTQISYDDDGEYFCRVLLCSSGTRFVNEAKVYYRFTGATSVSHIGASPRKIASLWRSMQLHIQYLRRKEDSPQVRQAALKYLETCFPYFYPEYTEIVEEAEQLARDLGGALSAPRMPAKYRWIQKTLGWPAAKKAQVLLPRYRWEMERLKARMLGGR